MKKKRNCPILFSDFLKDVNILCPIQHTSGLPKHISVFAPNN